MPDGVSPGRSFSGKCQVSFNMGVPRIQVKCPFVVQYGLPNIIFHVIGVTQVVGKGMRCTPDDQGPLVTVNGLIVVPLCHRLHCQVQKYPGFYRLQVRQDPGRPLSLQAKAVPSCPKPGEKIKMLTRCGF